MITAPKTVVIIGQGYVGLPVAMRAVEVGYNVVGLDLDEYRVAALTSGDSFVDDISNEELQRALASGRYIATSDYSHCQGFDVAVITVPTPLRDSIPDLSFIQSSSSTIAPYVTAGCTVILESTTYPGTTEELLVPVLEEGSGLKAGQDFSVGYSPERIDPGNKQWNFVQTPKVVSGIDSKSLSSVKSFYDTLVESTVPVSTPKEAELTKLLENTFRHVNIALVNELTVFGNQLGVNVWEAIEAAATKPFGYMKFTPGPGVGGHCLPVDPSYLSWQVRRKLGHNFRFVELANDINDHMPDYVVQRATRLLNEGRKSMNGSSVLLVGLAYKRNSGDIRESPSLRIIELMRELGAQILAADARVPDRHWPEEVERVEFDAETLARVDLTIVLTDHEEFDFGLLEKAKNPVFDTRRVGTAGVTELL